MIDTLRYASGLLAHSYYMVILLQARCLFDSGERLQALMKFDRILQSSVHLFKDEE
jgi:hypothetical protein